MKKLVTAPQGLRGSLTVPGDKSISHRAVMLGSISKGKTVIHHFLAGDDCLSTLAAFNALSTATESTRLKSLLSHLIWAIQERLPGC